jgi:hypothetical protein
MVLPPSYAVFEKDPERKIIKFLDDEAKTHRKMDFGARDYLTEMHLVS